MNVFQQLERKLDIFETKKNFKETIDSLLK